MAGEQQRLRRLCDVCGQLDDHPRHVQAVPDGTEGTVPSTEFLQSLPDGAPALAIAELMDPTTVVRHMDCCASKGCRLCLDTLEAAGGAHGAKLITALTGGAADNLGTPTTVVKLQKEG